MYTTLCVLCWCAWPLTSVLAQDVLIALDFKHLSLKMIYQQNMLARGKTFLVEREGKEKCLVKMEGEKNLGLKGQNQLKRSCLHAELTVEVILFQIRKCMQHQAQT